MIVTEDVVAVALLLQPVPEYATDTLYAPVVVAATVGVIDKDAKEPVVVAIPGPFQVYTGVPAPPASVAVSVMLPPEQRLDDDDVTLLITGCVFIVTEDDDAFAAAQPAPPYDTDTLYAPVVVDATVGVYAAGVAVAPVDVTIPGPLHV